MLELEHNGYYPLTSEHVREFVPSKPGVYILAIRLVSGVHKTFFTSQSDNLHSSLLRIARGDRTHVPQQAQACMEKYQPYFTYFVIMRSSQRQDVQTMLSAGLDHISNLVVFNEN